MRTHKFNELRDRLMQTVPDAPARMAEARRGALNEIEAYRKTLAEVRRARSVTQTEVAKALGVSQAQVSRIEHQPDLYLSTLEKYLAAIGARLELAAVFDNGTRVLLQPGDLTEEGLREAEAQRTELTPQSQDPEAAPPGEPSLTPAAG